VITTASLSLPPADPTFADAAATQRRYVGRATVAMTTTHGRFVTDTATVCIFDPASLRHRLRNDADWWSLPEEELREVNEGTALFVGLGADGAYDIVVTLPGSFTAEVTAQLSCPPGRVFLGAAEEVTSDGLEPDCTRGGLFVDVAPGTYSVAIARGCGGRPLLESKQRPGASGWHAALPEYAPA
jgi:hypothetical protein